MANIDRECHSSTVEITEQNMKLEQFIQKKKFGLFNTNFFLQKFWKNILKKYTKNIKKQSLSVEFNKTCLAGFLLLKYTSLNLRKYGS